jgi:hypothetical protein
MNIYTHLLLLTFTLSFNQAIAQNYGDGNYNENRPQRGARNNRQQQREMPPENNPTGYVSINSGFAIPQGSFASQTGLNYENHALSGSTEHISAGIPLNNSNFGIALSLGYSYHPFNANSYLTNIANADTSAYNYQMAGGSTNYKETNFMVGLFYTYPLGRFSFDFRAMLGIMSCSLPDIAYQAASNNMPVNTGYTFDEQWEISSSVAKTVSYDLGAGIRYALGRYFCLMMNADLLRANLTYNTNKQYLYYGNPYSSYPTNGSNTAITGTIPINMLNVTFGIGFQFGN